MTKPIQDKVRILVGSPVRQTPVILKEFLSSLERLAQDKYSLDYFFVDDNTNKESSQLLHEFAQKHENKCLISAPEYTSEKQEEHPQHYCCDDKTHYWDTEITWKVAAFKDQMIHTAFEKGYDYLFLIDSDLLLHPKTIDQLIADNKEIVANIFWTKWFPLDPLMPQVWVSDVFKRYESGILEELTPEEIVVRQEAFCEYLKLPGLYEVGGVGACTLISKTALAKGVSFKRLRNTTYWGEDIHFCLRAEALGIPRFVDTHYPAFHIYRESDLTGVEKFKKASEGKNGIWQPDFERPFIPEENDPLVSIVIVSSDKPRLLMEAVKSAIHQTYVNIEIIIVNDGGIDFSQQLESFHDDRIIYILHQNRLGVSAARNSGIRAAKGDYIAYLNEGDIFYQQHIQTLLSKLETSWFKVAYTDREYAFKALENDQLITYALKPSESLPADHDKLIVTNRIPIICLMHKKSCLDEVGFFDEKLSSFAAEWDLWIRLSKLMPFCYLAKVTAQEVIIAETKNALLAPIWSGRALLEIQLIHGHYQDDFDKKSNSKLAKQYRKEVYSRAMRELEEMRDEELDRLQPIELIQEIANSSLSNTQDDIRNARALSGYLTQRLSTSPEIWRTYAMLCRTLKDFRTAAIAITRALNIEESKENLLESHLIEEQAKAKRNQ